MGYSGRSYKINIMQRVLFKLVILLLINNAAAAQLGITNIGISNIGYDSLKNFNLGNATTPKCLFPGMCDSNCPVYTFNGSGNWNTAANWSGNVVPPVVLPNCYQIIIDPAGETECFLNTGSQILSSGSKLIVMPGKKLRIVPK